jgi:asparagine synthase (glutamine-hydrolysing)
VRRAVDQAVAALPSGIRAGRLSSVRRFMERSDLDSFDAFVSVVNLLRGEWREQLVGDASNWGIDDFRRIWDAFGEADLLDRLLVLNLRTYLLDDLLPKIDRMSMAHALEVRSPFLDRDLVEFALRLPRNLRVRGMGTKRVLRRAVADLLPSEILERGKRGFGIPLDRWFRSDLRSFVDGMLLSPDSHVKKHVSAAALERLVAEHQAGLGNYGMPLWGLLTLEVFLRKEGW